MRRRLYIETNQYKDIILVQDSHYKDKTVSQQSYLYNEISLLERPPLYRDGAQGPVSIQRRGFTSIGVPIIKIRRSDDCSLLYNGNPHTWKDGLYIGMEPRGPSQ